MNVTTNNGVDDSLSASVNNRHSSTDTTRKSSAELDISSSPSSSSEEERSCQRQKQSQSLGMIDSRGVESDASDGDDNDEDNEKRTKMDVSFSQRMEELEAIWKNSAVDQGDACTSNTPTVSLPTAVQETINLLRIAYDDLMDPARQTITQLQDSQARIQSMEQVQVAKDREIDRLRQAEIKSQQSISVSSLSSVFITFKRSLLVGSSNLSPASVLPNSSVDLIP
jgi:hypothetical protein